MPLRFKENRFGECCLTEAEAAYVAGLIDGEGTITLFTSGTEPGRLSRALRTKVSIANTNLLMLERVIEMTGNGAISTTGRRKDPAHKQGYLWRIEASQIRRILPQVSPYLVVKQRQAEIVLRVLEIQDGRRDRRERFYSDADIEEMLALYHEVRALNGRGTGESDAVEITVRDAKPMPNLGNPCRIEGCPDRRYPHAGDLCYKHWIETRSKIEKRCEYCGNPFQAVLDTKRYCSDKCQAANSWRERQKPERRALRLHNQECRWCHTVFETDEETKLYCTRSCYMKYRYAKKRAEEQGLAEPMSQEQRVRAKDRFEERNCLRCGVAFTSNNRKRAYCTHSCATMASQDRKQEKLE
jgi:LAGLIDADG DNA endonuclease family protein